MSADVAEQDVAGKAAKPVGDTRKSRILIVACFVLVCLIWGTTWFAIKLAVTDMPPLIASGLRFVIAAPVFIAACLYLKIPMRYPKGMWWFGIYICLGYFAIPFFLYNFGEEKISSGLAAICFSSVSVLMVVFSVPILRSRITVTQFVSVVVAFVALGFLIALSQGTAVTSAWGVVAMLVAAAMHAMAYIMIRKHAGGMHSLTINTLPMAAAGVLLTALGWIVERPGASAFTAQSVWATLYLGVVASVIGFAVYFWLVQKMNTVTVSFVFVLFPIVAQFISAKIGGTGISLAEILLMLVVLGAFATTQLARRRIKPQHEPTPATTDGAAPGEPVIVADLPSDTALAEIYQHAAESYPGECCGYVREAAVTRCANEIDALTASRPTDFDRTTRTGYAFGVTDLRAIAESFDGDSPVQIIYHSHPDVGAYFSDEDERHAVVDRMPVYPVRHLVVDATAAGVRGAKLFAFSAGRGHYVECASFGSPHDRRSQVLANHSEQGQA